MAPPRAPTLTWCAMAVPAGQPGARGERDPYGAVGEPFPAARLTCSADCLAGNFGRARRGWDKGGWLAVGRAPKEEAAHAGPLVGAGGPGGAAVGPCRGVLQVPPVGARHGHVRGQDSVPEVQAGGPYCEDVPGASRGTRTGGVGEGQPGRWVLEAVAGGVLSRRLREVKAGGGVGWWWERSGALPSGSARGAGGATTACRGGPMAGFAEVLGRVPTHARLGVRVVEPLPVLEMAAGQSE